MRISRDPVLLLNVVAAVIATLSAFVIHLTNDQQAVLNAVVFCAANVIAAFRVGDGQVAAIMGLMKGIVALGIGFGLHMTEEQQAVLMSLVAAAGMMWTRTQVKSPIPPAPADIAPVPVHVVQGGVVAQ
jgi:hypothetical protein